MSKSQPRPAPAPRNLDKGQGKPPVFSNRFGEEERKKIDYRPSGGAKGELTELRGTGNVKTANLRIKIESPNDRAHGMAAATSSMGIDSASSMHNRQTQGRHDFGDYDDSAKKGAELLTGQH